MLKRSSRDRSVESRASFEWSVVIPMILLFVLAVFAVVVYVVVIISGSYTSDDKDRLEKLLIPVITCVLGYLSGRANQQQ